MELFFLKGKQFGSKKQRNLIPGRTVQGVPLRATPGAQTVARRARFAGSTDPSASYRTIDPYLAGARYQRLRRFGFANTNGAPPLALRESYGELAPSPISAVVDAVTAISAVPGSPGAAMRSC